MTLDEASARDAARAALALAREWLAAALATLPAAVTSLGVGSVFSDADDRPRLDPALRATLAGAPDELAGAAEAVAALDDDLRAHTAPFLWALPEGDFLTVTR